MRFRWSLLSVGALACTSPDPDDAGAGGGATEPAVASSSPEAIRVLAQVRALAAVADAQEALAPCAVRGADPVDAHLGDSPSSGFTLSDPSGVAISARLIGGSATAFERVDDMAVAPGAGPGGAHVLAQVGACGVEDLLLFESLPSRAAIQWELRLDGGVAGLRLVDRTLEILDAGGAPRLRVAPPWLVDARGERVLAALELSGCAFDSDPGAPWGRTPTPPGASTCSLVVTWEWGDLRPPVLLDPLWSNTGSMVTARAEHTATLLGTGKVLVTGGSTGGATTSAAELYDPATQTWAATGNMGAPGRKWHTASLLQSGQVLVVGGYDNFANIAAAVRYTPASGTWSSAGSSLSPRRLHGASVLANGKVLVSGGSQLASQFDPCSIASAELYDPATNSWSMTGSMSGTRSLHTSTTLLNGKVLVTGGQADNCGIHDNGEVYDPASGSWTPTGNMSNARVSHGAALLASGAVVVAGGTVASQTGINVDLFTPNAATGTWSATGSLLAYREEHATSVLTTGNVVVSGGDGGIILKSTEVYDTAAAAWFSLGDLVTARRLHTSTALPNGSALVAGGVTQAGTPLASSERLTLSAVGTACGASAQCQPPAACSDGVCCASACSGGCDVCSVAAGASADGTCTPLPLGNPGSPACAGGHVCNGVAGACPATCANDTGCVASSHCSGGTCKPDLATGQPCTSPTQCISASCVEGVCCDSPCTGTCQACKASNKVSGADGICGLAKVGLDPHDDCPDDGPPSCQKDGTCDGVGACKLYAQGTECGAATCDDAELTEASCSGSGACLPVVTDCGAYACDGGACKSTCAGDSDCSSEAYCSGSTCVSKAAAGQTCTADPECVTGLVCVDGFCCNAPCTGQCEACDVPGAEGTCIPVTGEPHAGRPPCPSGSADDPCSEATCDGIERTTCAAFVGSAIACREGSCEGGIETLAATCDGLGHCPLDTKSCEPFACDGQSCATSCSADADCAAAYRCESGSCVASAACEDEATLVAADGTKTPCAPYACADRTCKTSCETVADCVAPAACDPQGRCVESPTAEADSGCATRRPGRDEGGAGALFLIAALLIGLRRRAAIAASAGVVACSSPDGAESTTAAADTTAASPVAEAVVREARAFEIPTSRPDPRRRDAEAPSSSPFVGRGLVQRLHPAERGDRLVAVVRDHAPRSEGARARVEVGARADAPTFVEDAGSGIWLEAALRGAHPVGAELAGGLVAYPGGGPGGGHVVVRVTDEGVEDFVVLPARLPAPELVYDVRVGGRVAGLRAVGDALELLDERGVPRLHGGRPVLVDARGVVRAARLDVEGCDVDRDPAPPWDRAPVPPGSGACVVRVVWDDAGLTHPIVVDPPWAVTSSLLGSRGYHAGTLLQSGKVLVAGGLNGLVIAWADVWDPATGTWATVPSMSTARMDAAMVTLADGRAFIMGGSDFGPALASAELYTPNGSWASAASMGAARVYHSATVLTSNKVLVVGGLGGGTSAETYDPAFDSWTGTGPMTSYRDTHTATRLANGRVLVAGGYTPVIGNSASIYDPSTNGWTTTGSMASARINFAASLLQNGKVLVSGGKNGQNATLGTAELYDPALGTWAPTGNLLAIRESHSSLTLPSGRVLVAAGYGGFFQTITEIYDPTLGQFFLGGNMNAGRAAHTATLLANGSVLATGGNVGNYIASCEVFSLSPQGAACTSTQVCQVGLTCSDGFCCNTVCGGACDVCAQALGASANGTCTVLAAGSAGSPSCAPYACNGMSGGCPASCATDVSCAGTAHCSGGTCKADLAIGAACTSSAQCQSGQCVEGVCCDSPCNGTCQACKATNKNAGPDGACGIAKDGTDPHDDCNDDGVASCNHDGMCNGAGACRNYSAGTQCMAVCSASTALSGECNGSGTCVVTQSDCAPYACDAGACASSCTTSADCAPGAWCDGGACAQQEQLGSPCSSADQCSSGVCADGLCCNVACDGQCEACDVRGAEGACVPVSGSPHAGHPACDAGSPSEPCTTKSCDGIARDSCEGWAGSTVVCRAATCEDGQATVQAVCDGRGNCPEATAIACTPFACGPDACLDACEAEADCAAGYACINGKCLAGATCEGHVVTAPDGSTKSCAPYVCEAGGACKPSCASVNDCAPGYACTQSGECIPKGQVSGEVDGGCSIAPPLSSRAWTTVLMGVAALALARRRRRAA